MRLIDADALEPHEQLEPLGNGQYEYVKFVYMDDIDVMPTIYINKEKNMNKEKSITIDFKNGETCHYAPDEYTDYRYDGKYFVVIFEKQWIGFYNLDEIRYIEIGSIEDAISRLEVHKEFLSKNGFYTKKAIDMAIEALKKQIPKKFNMVDDCIPVCPECGEEVWDMEWCNSCGQRLDTEED